MLSLEPRIKKGGVRQVLLQFFRSSNSGKTPGHLKPYLSARSMYFSHQLLLVFFLKKQFVKCIIQSSNDLKIKMVLDD